MPNWCSNSLKISPEKGNKSARAKFNKLKKEIEKDNDDFGLMNFFVPVPKALSNTASSFPKDPKAESNLEKYGYESWYDFCVNEWGTKWDAKVECSDSDKNSVTLYFDTAWSPPIELYRKLENKGFVIEATYIEQGCNFVGYYEDGNDVCEKLVAEDFDYDNEDPYEIFDYRMQEVLSKFDHKPQNYGG